MAEKYGNWVTNRACCRGAAQREKGLRPLLPTRAVILDWDHSLLRQRDSLDGDIAGKPVTTSRRRPALQLHEGRRLCAPNRTLKASTSKHISPFEVNASPATFDFLENAC